MRIQLILQCLILILEILGYEFLVLQEYRLTFAYQVADVASTRHDDADNKIAYRVKIVVYHRINGRNTEILVQVDKEFA